jgi:hypothetical protein
MRLLIIAAALLVPVSALAQPQAATVSELGHSLKPGERLTVTGRIDGDIRSVRGRSTLLADALLIERDDVRYTFSLDAIERIERPKDRIWNGALIGYAAGFTPFALAEIECQRSPGCWEGLPFAVGLVIAGPIGFGIGALTDALIHRPTLVYANDGSRGTMSVSPLITHGGAGVRISVVF